MSLTVQVPTVGQANSTEAVKVTNTLTNLNTWANGGIPGSDLSPTAAVARSQLAGGFGNLVVTSVAVDTAAADGRCYIVTATKTVTLPAPTANVTVGVVNNAVGGTVTVAKSTGTGFWGVGLGAAASFTLGTFGSSVVLVADGANWWVVAGQQDTGWVALSLTAGVTTTAGTYTPSVRLRGDHGFLKGGLTNTSAGSVSNYATIPVGMRPTSTVRMPGQRDASTGAVTIFTIATTGIISGGTVTNGLDIGYLDSINFALS